MMHMALRVGKMVEVVLNGQHARHGQRGPERPPTC